MNRENRLKLEIPPVNVVRVFERFLSAFSRLSPQNHVAHARVKRRRTTLRIYADEFY